MTARAITAFVLQFGFVRFLLRRCLAVVSIFGEDRPNDPRRLTRHSNRCKADGVSFEKLHDQRVNALWVAMGTLHLRRHANHKQTSKISVSLLADAARPLFAATRSVERRKAQPGGNSPRIRTARFASQMVLAFA